MVLKTYQRLSRYYDFDWGDFSLRFSALVQVIMNHTGRFRQRVLDLACGTGSLALSLGSKGHFVYGIDISPQMIEVAKTKLDCNQAVSFEVKDMSSFSVKKPFDIATCSFDAINYLPDLQKVKDMFRCVYSALRMGGIFIFDSATEKLYLKFHRGTYTYELNGDFFIQSFYYDPLEKVAVTCFKFSDGNTEVHRQYPYGLKELKPLLKKVGFSSVKRISIFQKKKYDFHRERLLCMVKK